MKQTLWLVLCWIVFVGRTEAASFDCIKAASTVEKIICSDKELSKLDEDFSDIYYLALQQGIDKQIDKQQVAKEQKLWLKNIRNVCQDAGCVKDAYKKRIDSIDLAQESFLHFECDPDNAKILLDNNPSIDELPVASHTGKLSLDDRATLRKLGYYSVQRTMDVLTCKFGADTYSFFIRFHKSRARGECAAAEFWSLWALIPSGGQFIYTLDGEVCIPYQPLLDRLRLDSTPSGQSMSVCTSDDFDDPVVCKDISLPLKGN